MFCIVSSTHTQPKLESKLRCNEGDYGFYITLMSFVNCNVGRRKFGPKQTFSDFISMYHLCLASKAREALN